MDADPGAAGLGFFVRALVASAIVGVVCAVVGTYVVLRGIAFIGDAISHAAFPGVVAAYLLGTPFYLGAAIAAVATALAIGFVEPAGNLRSDTAIGVLFAGTFALGVFMFSTIEGYVGDLFGFLFGNVLAIGAADLVALVVLGWASWSSSCCSGRSSCTRRSTRSARPRRASGSAGSRPVPRPRRTDDRGQPPGGRDHPRRRDAGDARGDGAAAHRPVRAVDAHGGRHRRALGRWSGCSLVLARRGERRDHRAGADPACSSSR